LQEKLKALLELQKVDLEISALRKSAEVYPKQTAELERELTMARSALEAERAQLLEVDRQKRTLEQNITDEKDKVKKWEARLAEQRSTREYSALAREIDIAKKAQLSMAEQLSEMTKSIGAAREAVRAKEQELAGRQDQIGGKLRELREKSQGLDNQVKELEALRTKTVTHVDRTLLHRYDTVRKKRLPALVSVVAGTCQGCNMNVPPQLYNTLATTLGVDLCPSCHRMICAQAVFESAAK
jgi:predicted  nucleic acid-binding Zn-ribbon protein